MTMNSLDSAQGMTAVPMKSRSSDARLGALSRISTAVADWTDLSSADNVLRAILDALDLDAGAIRCVDEGGQELVLLSHMGLPFVQKEMPRVTEMDGPIGLIARTLRPLVVEDFSKSGVEFLPATTEGFRSFVGVPLTLGDELAGVLVGLTRDSRSFAQEDIEFLSAAGKMVGLAINNARLLGKVSKAKKEWEQAFDAMSEGVAFVDASRRIVRVNAALPGLLGTTREKLLSSTCYTVIHHSGGPVLGCPLSLSSEDSKAWVSEHEFRCGNRWLQMRADPATGPDGRMAGVVHVFRDITDRKIAEEHEAQVRRLNAIRQVSETVAATLDLKTVAEMALESTLKALDMDCGIVYGVRGSAGEMVLLAHGGFPPELSRRLDRDEIVDPGECESAAMAAMQDKPLIIGDTSQMPEAGNLLLSSAPWSSYGSHIGLPLKVKERVVGVLSLFAVSRQTFTPEKMEMLTSIGNMVGMAIANARLFEDVGRSQKEWEATFDAISDGVLVLDRDLKVLRANRAFEKIFSTRGEAIEGRHCYEVVHGTLGPPLNCPTCASRLSGKPFQATIRQPPPGNRWLYVRGDPILSGQDGVIGLVHTFRDVTEQEKAGIALKESEERFRSIFSRSPIGIELFDADGRLVDANPACLEIFGIKSVSEVKGFNLYDDPNITDRVRARLLAQQKTRFEADFDFDKVKQLGLYETTRSGTLHLDVLITPLGRRKQVRGGFLVQVQDVSQGRRARQDLKNSERNFRALAENAKVGIVIVGAEARPLFANKRATDMVGVARKNLGRVSVVEHILPADHERLTEIHKKLQGHKLPPNARWEATLVRKNGGQVPVEFSAAKTTWHGQPAILIMFEDVSRQKRLKESNQSFVLEVIKAQEEERKRISGELHDDLVQTLCLLSLEADALEGKLPLQNKALKGLRDGISRAAEDARRFCQDLRPEVLDQLGLVPALRTISSEIKEKTGIDSRVTVTGRQLRLASDVETVLYRVAQECLNNMRKHSRATRVRIKLQFDESAVRLVVTDNGRGFKAPANPGDLAVRGRLGLRGIQERARLVNGRLEIQGRPMKGTRISLEVPLDR